MSWRDELRRASFRGVPFFVEGHGADVGRRVHVHEYPLRDQPWAEDLGRATRRLSIDAYVLGADYMRQRDALVRAVEAKGPGLLVHPYLGELRVTVLSCRLEERVTEGGLARFALEFVEAGAQSFPGDSNDTRALVAAAVPQASTLAVSSFTARHNVARQPAYVAATSAGLIGQALQVMQGAARQVRGAAAQVAEVNAAIAATQRDLLTLVYAPASAAQAVAGNIRALVRSLTTAPREQWALARSFFRFGSLVPGTPATPSRRAEASAVAEIVRLVRVTAAAEAALASTRIQFDSFQEATALRDELLAVLDQALVDAADDAMFNALRGLRAAVVRDVAARGADLARLVDWTPATVMPVLVAAYRLYSDPEREGELLRRNRQIRHPLFTPPGQPLEVLTDAA